MMTVSETTQVIDHIANKLQVPTSKLLELAPAIGIEDAVFALVLLLLFLMSLSALIVSLYYWRKHQEASWVEGISRRESYHHEEKATHALACAFIAGIGVLMTVVPLAFNLPSAVLWIYNPQAWLLRNILHALGIS